ncbi:MAG: DUF6777 domain-containing protein [Acidimicrobiales bacterium]
MSTAPSGPPPPPPGPPPSPGTVPGGRPPWLVPGAIITAIVVLVLLLVSQGDDKKVATGVTDTTSSGPGEIFLEAAASTGPDPFAPSVAAATPTSTIPPDTPVTLGTAPPGGSPPTAPVFKALPPPPGGGAVAITPRSGGTPGLYGGTRDQSSCDQQKMVDFLAANPDKARAFAEAQTISLDEVGSFVKGLTSALLRNDTRVTNHGFRAGRPTAHQSVLQAGTAVMVDQRGVPRVRCACGNPLLAPQAASSTPSYQGTPWTGFSPTNVTVVSPSTTVINIITLIDVVTGGPFGRPAGPGRGPDTTLPPETTTTLPPTTLPPVTVTTTGPTTTLPFVTVPTAPRPTVPPTTAAPRPTAPPQTAPPTTAPPTTAALSTTWNLREVRFVNGPFTTVQLDYRVTRQPSASGGEVVWTIRDGGTFCTGGGTDEMRMSWSFPRSVATVRNGESLAGNLQGSLVASTGGCTGGVAAKTYFTMIGTNGSSVPTTPFARPVDGSRFSGGGNRALVAPGSPAVTTSVDVGRGPSDPGRPEAGFAIQFEGPGLTFFAVYIYQQA